MNYNYKIDYTTLEDGTKTLNFVFDEGPNVFTTFFASDVEEFPSVILEQIDQVLSKKKKHVECSASRSICPATGINTSAPRMMTTSITKRSTSSASNAASVVVTYV